MMAVLPRMAIGASFAMAIKPLMAGLIGETFLGIFLVVEGAWKVLVADDVAAIFGIAALGLAFLVNAGASRLQKK